MTTLVSNIYLPDMMASGTMWLPRTAGGPQNFLPSQTQSRASKGYNSSSQASSRSRAPQNGTTPGMEDAFFNNNNMPYQWKDHPNTSAYAMDEMAPLFSKTSLETMVSNSEIPSGSDYPGTLDSSYSVSSEQMDNIDCSSNLSETALYTDSTNYNVDNEFSELQFVDDDTIPRTGVFHAGLGNDISRPPTHLIPLANGSPMQIFATTAVENIYTTGSEIMPHSVVTSGAHPGDYSPDFSWISGDHAAPKVSSPTYSVSGLSIPMSRRSSTRDALSVFNGQSPRSSRKSVVPNNMIGEDSEPLDLYEDRLNERSRRLGDSSEIDNVARDHPYYHAAVRGPDRLFHCPWESMDPPCNHKPEKLKCNYDKCVDSHLKPYRCKVQSCGESRFSSTACLLRHEREAHAMHGHGEKPFLCTADSCERAIPGNGFPRHWNLRDHMKRVHNTVPEPTDPDQPVRGTRKRKASSVDGKTRKKTANSPPKETIQPVKNELSPEDQFYEHRRQLMSAMELLNDPSDPENLTKLRRANSYLKEMAATSAKIARINSPTG